MTNLLRSTGLAALAACGVWLLGALPAHAGDGFGRGFEDELGRIAAHEAVGLGRHLLVEVIHGGHGYRHGYRRGHHRYSEPPRRQHRRRRHHYRVERYRGRYDDHHRYRRHERRRHSHRHRGYGWR